MPKAKTVESNDKKKNFFQSNNILYFMMAVVTVFSIYLFIRVQALEKKLATATGSEAAQNSPLSIDKLKSYAKELKLDTKKFNKCLESDAKKTAVDKELKEGIALGVQGTPGFFINGRLLAGAFPFEYFKEVVDKTIDGTATDECTGYSETLQQYCSDPQNKAFDPVVKKVEIGDAPTTGAKDASITIIEFSDFECPYCSKAYATVEQVMKEYKGKVKLIYKQFPLTQIHPQAQKAAEASLCAKDQGKFWEFYHKVFTLEQPKS